MTDVSPGTFLLGILNNCISSLILLWHKVSQARHVERPYGEVLRKQLTGKINTELCLSACVLSRVRLCNATGCSPPGSFVQGISQARILEWVPFPPPGDLPDPGIEPKSLVSRALAGWFFTSSATWIKAISVIYSSSVQFSSVQFSRSVVSDSLRHHESQHATPPCPSPTP